MSDPGVYRERWHPVKGYEGLYEVSNLGNVRSLDRPDTNAGRRGFHGMGGRILRQAPRKGYMLVSLYRDGKGRKVSVHRLVAEAFLCNPLGKEQVNHIDGNTANNAVSNLEWATASENNQHAFDAGLKRPCMDKAHAARRRPVVRDDGRVFASIAEAARHDRISARGISHILHGDTRNPRGHSYRFVEVAR